MRKKWLNRRVLDIKEILAWADAYREATGAWPTGKSGPIVGAKFETWAAVESALRGGRRGLPGGSSLARLLAQERGRRLPRELPELTPTMILAWVDAYHGQTETWPTRTSGTIPQSGGETWAAVATALQEGRRGLPGSSSLARFLAQHRGHRHRQELPPLDEARILTWADAHRQRTGSWPNFKSGPIAEAPGETWGAVQHGLYNGQRSLPGGSSLALLLAEQRGARNFWTVPALSLEKILAWADAFHERTQAWPHSKSGPIAEAPGETWTAVDKALRKGRRGLPEVSSLAQVLARERGVPNRLDPPPLTIKDIVAWADAHFRRTARWPTKESGPVDGAPQHSWRDVDSALRYGHRGLPGGSSLARLLHDRRRKRNPGSLAPLSFNKILAWADAHHNRTGQWPKKTSGPIDGVPGEEWRLVDNALHLGLRGLQRGSSLLRLLKRKRGVRDRNDLPPLNEEQILRWADQHFQRCGSWPNGKSGPIAEAPGETWTAVDIALHRGKRGLAGGSSLAQLLRKAGRGKGAGGQERTPVAKNRDPAKP